MGVVEVGRRDLGQRLGRPVQSLERSDAAAERLNLGGGLQHGRPRLEPHIAARRHGVKPLQDGRKIEQHHETDREKAQSAHQRRDDPFAAGSPNPEGHRHRPQQRRGHEHDAGARIHGADADDRQRNEDGGKQRRQGAPVKDAASQIRGEDGGERDEGVDEGGVVIAVCEQTDRRAWVGDRVDVQAAARPRDHLQGAQEQAGRGQADPHQRHQPLLGSGEDERAHEHGCGRGQRQEIAPGRLGRKAEWLSDVAEIGEVQDLRGGLATRQSLPDSRWQGDQLEQRDGGGGAEQEQRPTRAGGRPAGDQLTGRETKQRQAGELDDHQGQGVRLTGAAEDGRHHFQAQGGQEQSRSANVRRGPRPSIRSRVRAHEVSR